MSQENVAVVKAIYAAFGRRDMGAAVGMVGADLEIVQSREVPWGGEYCGVEGLENFFAALRKHLNQETGGLVFERFLDAGDHVVAVGRTRGVVVANGRPFDVPLVHVWEVREGKGVRFRPYIDHPTMWGALGSSSEVGA